MHPVSNLPLQKVLKERFKHIGFNKINVAPHITVTYNIVNTLIPVLQHVQRKYPYNTDTEVGLLQGRCCGQIMYFFSKTRPRVGWEQNLNDFLPSGGILFVFYLKFIGALLIKVCSIFMISRYYNEYYTYRYIKTKSKFIGKI